MRQAELSDADLLFKWRNDPSTFKFFRNAGPISPAEHVFWVNEFIGHPEHELWLAHKKLTPRHMPSGVIRFDSRNDDAWEVSITVDPTDRGKGYGQKMLEAACAMKHGPLIAEINAKNAASIRIFEKCGFKRVTMHDLPFLLFRRDRVEAV